MPLIEINTQPTDRVLRQFAGLVIPLSALVVLALLWTNACGWPWIVGAAIVSTAIISVGLIHPQAVKPVYLAWVFASFPLGWVVGHIVLGVVYYLVFTPIGLAMRLLGRDPLTRDIDPNRTSYWEPRDGDRDPGSYFKQF